MIDDFSGVRLKKFEQISPKICGVDGIPPVPSQRPPRLEVEAKRTISSFSLAALLDRANYKTHKIISLVFYRAFDR